MKIILDHSLNCGEAVSNFLNSGDSINLPIAGHSLLSIRSSIPEAKFKIQYIDLNGGLSVERSLVLNSTYLDIELPGLGKSLNVSCCGSLPISFFLKINDFEFEVPVPPDFSRFVEVVEIVVIDSVLRVIAP